MPEAAHVPVRIVQSRANSRVKQLRAALAKPSPRQIGLEGLHLIEEALRSGVCLETLFIRAGSEALLRLLPAGVAEVAEILLLPEEILRSAVTTGTPQPLAALAVPPVFSPEQVFQSPCGRPLLDPLVLVLDGLQDPGNLGTILRSAEAFGASGILTLPGTANLWNPKSLRASMGSAFRLPVAAIASAEAAAGLLGERGLVSAAAVAPGHEHAVPVGTVDLRAPVALWIGNEGAGLSREALSACALAVSIPCPGRVESLNAAIAAGVLLYEASRQRGETLRQPEEASPRRSVASSQRLTRL